jgi:hypothetical protein
MTAPLSYSPSRVSFKVHYEGVYLFVVLQQQSEVVKQYGGGKTYLGHQVPE